MTPSARCGNGSMTSDEARREKMWNALARTHSFTLLCGYPIAAFEPSQAQQIAEVGRAHSQVAPIQAFPRAAPA